MSDLAGPEIKDPRQSGPELTDAQFKFSPNLLEHLGVAAYNSLKKCLAET